MTQDFGHEGEDNSPRPEEPSSESLPDFLRTEPIPVVTPPSDAAEAVHADETEILERVSSEPETATDEPEVPDETVETTAEESPSEADVADEPEVSADEVLEDEALVEDEPVEEEPVAEDVAPAVDEPVADEPVEEATEVVEAAPEVEEPAAEDYANDAATQVLDEPETEILATGAPVGAGSVSEAPPVDSWFGGTNTPSSAEPLQEAADAVKARKKKSSPGKKVTIGLVSTLAVLAAAYVGAAWYFADRVPTDTSVAGVDISGLTQTEAVERLNTELHDVMTSDIAVTLGASESTIEPEAAGLSVDIPGSVERLVGFTLDPSRVFGHFFGIGPQEPIINSDSASLRRAIESIEENLNVDPVEGEIAIVEGEIETVEPVDGVAINVDEAMDLIVEEWLQGDRPVELPGVVLPPTMNAERIAEVRASVIDPLFSGDIELSINEHTAQVPNETIINAASLHLTGTTYELQLDPEPLADAVKPLFPGLGESPKDARFIFENGRPVIVPSVTGAGINPETLATELAAGAVKTGADRKVSIELEATEPDFTTADAEALGIKERVSHFKTPVPYDPVRTKNLVTGARKLTGILVKPGETFSLIDALSPIDAAHGYVNSGVVVNGFADTAMGGGLSQMSTTVFNAAFEAGLEDVTHTPHSRYFTRYPAGREATMFLPNLDMKFRNNTPYGVLVQSWIDDDAHVALWSTKYWDTKITTGPRTNFTSPRTVYNTSSRCTPERGGQPGFTVSVQRIVSKDGVRNDKYSRSYTHTYQPWNNVVCGEKPKPQPTPPPAEDNSDN